MPLFKRYNREWPSGSIEKGVVPLYALVYETPQSLEFKILILATFYHVAVLVAFGVSVGWC